MTTEVTAAEVIRRIGRLEGQQEQIIARLDRMDGRVDRLEGRIDRLAGRVDRMVFTMWVVGGGIIAAVGAVIVKLFLGG
jgi:tetrahydromethanopterin S-methyltransferase subunit B